MSDLLRDTLLGQTVRLLSGRTLLTFPDEQNPDLWKAFVPEGKHYDGTPRSNIGIDQDGEHPANAVNTAQASSSEEQHSTYRDPVTNDEKDGEVMLVDWYDSNDQEVHPITITFTEVRWLIDYRTPRTGQKAASC